MLRRRRAARRIEQLEEEIKRETAQSEARSEVVDRGAVVSREVGERRTVREVPRD